MITLTKKEMQPGACTIRPGTIRAYNPENATGLVLVRVTARRRKPVGSFLEFPFDLTRFTSGRPTRPPRVGEPVEVVFNNEGGLLNVRVPG